VTVLAVAEDVDDNVPRELLAELEREPRHVDYGLRVFPVHVEYRNGSILATSVGKKVDRASFVEVVNPIWLFTTK